MTRTFRDSLESDLEAFYSASEFGREFTLSRGTVATADVVAVTATRIYERIDSGGIGTEIESVDFDLPASSYLIDGVQVDPAPGDRFGDGENAWEAMAIGRRKCFEPLDGDALAIRVHTRKVVSG